MILILQAIKSLFCKVENRISDTAVKISSLSKELTGVKSTANKADRNAINAKATAEAAQTMASTAKATAEQAKTAVENAQLVDLHIYPQYDLKPLTTTPLAVGESTLVTTQAFGDYSSYIDTRPLGHQLVLPCLLFYENNKSMRCPIILTKVDNMGYEGGVWFTESDRVDTPRYFYFKLREDEWNSVCFRCV